MRKATVLRRLENCPVPADERPKDLPCVVRRRLDALLAQCECELASLDWRPTGPVWLGLACGCNRCVGVGFTERATPQRTDHPRRDRTQLAPEGLLGVAEGQLEAENKIQGDAGEQEGEPARRNLTEPSIGERRPNLLRTVQMLGADKPVVGHAVSTDKEPLRANTPRKSVNETTFTGDHGDEATSRPQQAPRLDQRCGQVWQVLEYVYGQHTVEGCIRERQPLLAVADDNLDVWVRAAKAVGHLLAQLKCDIPGPIRLPAQMLAEPGADLEGASAAAACRPTMVESLNQAVPLGKLFMPVPHEVFPDLLLLDGQFRYRFRPF